MMKQRLMSDLKEAMKSRDTVKVSTIRFLQSEIKNREISIRSENRELTEQEMVEVMLKEAKKRRENIELYKNNNREDLAEKEQKELDIISEYLPSQMSENEISSFIDQELAKMENPQFTDAVKVIMPLLKGKADGKVASNILKSKLN